MSDKSYDEDILQEFDRLKETKSENRSSENYKNEELSKTMVVPRVEDLIEERPLQPATDVDSLLAELPLDTDEVNRIADEAQSVFDGISASVDSLYHGSEKSTAKEAEVQEETELQQETHPEQVLIGRRALKAEQTKQKDVLKLEKLKFEKQKSETPKPEKQKPERQKPERKKPEKQPEEAVTVAQADKDEKKERKKQRRKKRRRIFLILLGTVFVLAIAACAVVGKYVYDIVKDVPEIYPDNIYELLSENSIIYDKDGNVLDNVYQGDSLRTNLEYSQIPTQLIDAFVSIEDKTFWEHHGFNFVRIAGAVVEKITGKSEKIGGTSTITQQLARNLYLADIKSQRSMERKITEAYYTLELEKQLSKEQIIEAYLNTIYLGYNCNGVAAAAQAYFSKDVSELTLIECCQLAALPQSPNAYAPLKRVTLSTVDEETMETLDIITKDESYVVYYNDAASDRIKLVLYYMHDQGKIDDATYASTKADSIRYYLNPGSSAINNVTTSYFADYVKETVLEDLIAAGYDEDTATGMLYSGGLRINSTMDLAVQEIMDKEYDNPENFPGISIQYSDKNGNIYNEDYTKILLYKSENYFNENGDFVLSPNEYEFLANGDLKVYSGKRLNIYRTMVAGEVDYSVEFKYLYEVTEDNVFYSRAGGVWSIDAKYKDRNENGDLLLSKSYFDDYPEAFTQKDDGSLVLSQKYFTLKQLIRQPQSAMVIMDYENGHILGMVGGRDLKGKLLYNRATSPRQTGSSVKPLSVYSVALQLGKEGAVGYTAAMPLDDMPMLNGDKIWPKNAYTGYRGVTNLRNAVEQSINACSVSLFMKMANPMRSINQLQKMGITTLVTEGEVNDINASALALGGMTKGISPLEMTAAYGTFGNFGVYTEPICYTTVTTKSGDIILEKTPLQTQVMDEDVASLMTDILRTVVTNGLGSKAKLESQPSAGKTGTTSEKYDIWFCGLTPQYSAACWIGSDVNIPVSSDSSYAAKLWGTIMDQVGALVPREEFELRGEFVTETVNKYTGGASDYSTGDDTITEIFIKGTEPSAVGTESTVAYGTAEVCDESGYLATPWCYEAGCGTHTVTGVIRPGGVSWERTLENYKASLIEDLGEESALKYLAGFSVESVRDSAKDLPDLYCPYHNMDTETYPAPSVVTEHTGVQLEGDIIDMDPEDMLNPEVTDGPVDENGDPIVGPGESAEGGETGEPGVTTEPGITDDTGESTEDGTTVDTGGNSEDSEGGSSGESSEGSTTDEAGSDAATDGTSETESSSGDTSGEVTNNE